MTFIILSVVCLGFLTFVGVCLYAGVTLGLNLRLEGGKQELQDNRIAKEIEQQRLIKLRANKVLEDTYMLEARRALIWTQAAEHELRLEVNRRKLALDIPRFDYEEQEERFNRSTKGE